MNQMATKSESRRRKMSVKSVAMFRVADATVVSILTISNAQLEDSGTYQCRPSNMASANVTLHVLDGIYRKQCFKL